MTGLPQPVAWSWSSPLAPFLKPRSKGCFKCVYVPARQSADSYANAPYPPRALPRHPQSPFTKCSCGPIGLTIFTWRPWLFWPSGMREGFILLWRQSPNPPPSLIWVAWHCNSNWLSQHSRHCQVAGTAFSLHWQPGPIPASPTS